MFKFFFGSGGSSSEAPPSGCRHPAWKTLAVTLLLLEVGGGCVSVPPLPPVDLAQPGWQKHEGQAVWQPKADSPELAGDLLVAVRGQAAFVQFIKDPFPIAVAQTTPTGWQLELPMQNKRYAGRGKAPNRLVWLQLPRTFAGHTMFKPWAYEELPENRWRLTNGQTGETLEGVWTR